MTIHDILHDPCIFKAPYEFTPERWLEEFPPNDLHFVPFGKGTRMCPGMRYVVKSPQPLDLVDAAANHSHLTTSV